MLPHSVARSSTARREYRRRQIPWRRIIRSTFRREAGRRHGVHFRYVRSRFLGKRSARFGVPYFSVVIAIAPSRLGNERTGSVSRRSRQLIARVKSIFATFSAKRRAAVNPAAAICRLETNPKNVQHCARLSETDETRCPSECILRTLAQIREDAGKKFPPLVFTTN